MAERQAVVRSNDHRGIGFLAYCTDLGAKVQVVVEPDMPGARLPVRPEAFVGKGQVSEHPR